MKASADTLGINGTFIDPLWRIEVRLTPIEQDLLRSWWVRRLGFINHAGAASATTTQSYTRLEHSLGLLALVSHFTPNDHHARVAALLHDIGHLPFSHTFEQVAGLDHHVLGTQRIQDLSAVLERKDSIPKRSSTPSMAPGAPVCVAAQPDCDSIISTPSSGAVEHTAEPPNRHPGH